MHGFSQTCEGFLSRLVGLNARRLSGLLGLAYKCRIRLPIFVSATFLLCHLVLKYVPRVEINVQVVEEEEEEEEDGQDGSGAEPR